jgi:hypothetical protein
MRGSEIGAAGELLADTISGTGALIGDLHAAVAGRAFGAVGPIGKPVRIAHDRLSGAAYAGVRRALRAVPASGTALLARSVPEEARSLSASVRGSLALGALNGAIGDALSSSGSPLALSMSVRLRGRDLDLDRDSLAAAFPGASGRLVVFVHGLSETDDAWRFRRRGEGPRGTYGSRMREELGFTPLYLRYNTGLHISDNGRRLAALLDSVVEGWPVDVREIVLVGHSMGGLVARSACHYGHADERAWVASLRHVFCLGSPHLGAPLEKATNVLGWGLSRLPETRPMAKIVNRRSVGIKDLRFGSCAEEDWCDCEPDEFLRDRCREVPFLETATYYFVGATLSREPNGPLGAAIGDLLVRFPSASGSGRRRKLGFEVDNGCHLGGLTHFDLLNHPAVYDRMHSWLTREAPAALQLHA